MTLRRLTLALSAAAIVAALALWALADLSAAVATIAGRLAAGD